MPIKDASKICEKIDKPSEEVVVEVSKCPSEVLKDIGRNSRWFNWTFGLLGNLKVDCTEVFVPAKEADTRSTLERFFSMFEKK